MDLRRVKRALREYSNMLMEYRNGLVTTHPEAPVFTVSVVASQLASLAAGLPADTEGRRVRRARVRG